MGSKEFGYSVLNTLIQKFDTVEWLVLHPNDLSDQRSVYTKYRQLEAENVRVRLVENKLHFSEILEDQNDYKFAFVCGWYWLISKQILCDETKPFYGIHHSDLPSYRGGAPLVWALINGEKKVASSLFRIRAGMDDGEIIQKIYYNVSISDNINVVLRYFEKEWEALMPKIFHCMITDEVPLQHQTQENISYCSQRYPTDGKIDWRRSAVEIHNFIRAQSHPYSGAYTVSAESKIFIERARVFNYPYYAPPGKVICHDGEKILVGCGDDMAIEILSVRAARSPVDTLKGIQSF